MDRHGPRTQRAGPGSPARVGSGAACGSCITARSADLGRTRRDDHLAKSIRHRSAQGFGNRPQPGAAIDSDGPDAGRLDEAAPREDQRSEGEVRADLEASQAGQVYRPDWFCS